jgi:hypothetical protein
MMLHQNLNATVSPVPRSMSWHFPVSAARIRGMPRRRTGTAGLVDSRTPPRYQWQLGEKKGAVGELPVDTVHNFECRLTCRSVKLMRE